MMKNNIYPLPCQVWKLKTSYDLELFRTSMNLNKSSYLQLKGEYAMYDEIPVVMYLSGVLFSILSWIYLSLSKCIHIESRRIFILQLSIIWILFMGESALTLASILFFNVCSSFLNPDVYDFYSQEFIQLAPTITCIINFFISMYFSIRLVKAYKTIK